MKTVNVELTHIWIAWESFLYYKNSLKNLKEGVDYFYSSENYDFNCNFTVDKGVIYLTKINGKTPEKEYCFLQREELYGEEKLSLACYLLENKYTVPKGLSDEISHFGATLIKNVRYTDYMLDYFNLYFLGNNNPMDKCSLNRIKKIPFKTINSIEHESFYNQNYLTIYRYGKDPIIIEFAEPYSLMEVKTNIKAKWLDYQQDRK